MKQIDTSSYPDLAKLWHSTMHWPVLQHTSCCNFKLPLIAYHLNIMSIVIVCGENVQVKYSNSFVKFNGSES